MATRRDNPNGALWRLAVHGLNQILTDDLSRIHGDYKKDLNVFKHSRARFWKEVADVYEVFLVGSCGHALSSYSPSAEALKADESIEMTVLDILGNSVLKGQIDAPTEVSYSATTDGCLLLMAIQVS